MNVVARLVAFVLVLVLLFAGGFAVGRVVGPVGAEAPPAADGSPASGSTHNGSHP